MSRESRVLISRMIVVLIFISSLAALVLGDFLITLITVAGGLILWLLYLVAADLGAAHSGTDGTSSLGQSISKVVAGLGGVLAVSAFRTYGLQQTMWGSYTFELAGVALGLAVLVLALLPLLLVQLIRKPAGPAPPIQAGKSVSLPAAGAPGQNITRPEQQVYYGTPQPQAIPAYGPEEAPAYEEEDEDWDEGTEEDDGDLYYDEESDFYEDEEEEDRIDES